MPPFPDQTPRLLKEEEYKKLKDSWNFQHWRNPINEPLRFEVMLRAEWKCERCKHEGYLDVHHLDGNPYHNTLANLIVLCRSCHLKEHRKP
jgi:5-methylcytosine-specific restriction endonuclease McrA